MSLVADILAGIGFNLNRTIDASSEPSEAECIAWINQTLDWLVQILAENRSELGRTLGSITCSESAITAITAANPGSVTSTAHGFADGDLITIDGVVGMTEVNDTEFTTTYVDANTYTLGVDTSAYTAYTSGGYGYKSAYDDFATTLYSVGIMIDSDGDEFSGWIEKTNSRDKLKLVTEASRVNYAPGESDDPACFYLDGSNNIVFLPAPNDDFTIKIPYYPIATIAEQDDTIPFLNIFDNLIIEGISTKYLYRTREDVGIEWNWFSFVKKQATRILQLRRRQPVKVF